MNIMGLAMASFRLIPSHRRFITDCGNESELSQQTNKGARRWNVCVCIRLQLGYQGHRWGNHASSWSPDHNEMPGLGLQNHRSHGGGRHFTCDTNHTPYQTERTPNDYIPSLNCLGLKGRVLLVTSPALTESALPQKSDNSLLRMMPVREE